MNVGGIQNMSSVIYVSSGKAVMKEANTSLSRLIHNTEMNGIVCSEPLKAHSHKDLRKTLLFLSKHKNCFVLLSANVLFSHGTFSRVILLPRRLFPFFAWVIPMTPLYPGSILIILKNAPGNPKLGHIPNWHLHLSHFTLSHFFASLNTAYFMYLRYFQTSQLTCSTDTFVHVCSLLHLQHLECAY